MDKLIRKARPLLLPLLCAAALSATGCAPPAQQPAGSTLTVEEYPIVDRAVDQPTHFEYRDRIPAEALARRSDWRNRPSARMNDLDAANQALSPFGYRLVPAAGEKYSLLKGDALSAEGILAFGPVEVSAGGDSFAFGADIPGRGSVLVGPQGAAPWDPGLHFYQRPVFAGNDLLMVRALNGQLDQYEVLRGERAVYKGKTDYRGVDLPIKGLNAWEGRWVLEVAGQVLVEGQSLNRETGYEEIFEWQLISGKPFFLFRDGDKYGAMYDGKALGVAYDEIIHYRCCEPAAFNPGGNGHMVWFHARRGETWHYVEMGDYLPLQ